jgi:hypothetical protein
MTSLILLFPAMCYGFIPSTESLHHISERNQAKMAADAPVDVGVACNYSNMSCDPTTGCYSCTHDVHFVCPESQVYCDVTNRCMPVDQAIEMQCRGFESQLTFKCQNGMELDWTAVCDGYDDCRTAETFGEDERMTCEEYCYRYKRFFKQCTCRQEAPFCLHRTITCHPGYELVDQLYCEKTVRERLFVCKCFSDRTHPHCNSEEMTLCSKAFSESTCVQSFNKSDQVCYCEVNYNTPERISHNLPICGTQIPNPTTIITPAPSRGNDSNSYATAPSSGNEYTIPSSASVTKYSVIIVTSLALFQWLMMKL